MKIHPRTVETLVLMAGLPGTGKSKLAYQIAKRLRWIVLDKDIIHTALISKGLSSAEAGPAAYEAVLCLVKDLISNQGQSVILDTAGRQPFILDRARLIAAETQATLKIVRCVAPYEVRSARLAGRIPLESQWATNQATDAEQELWYAHLPSDSCVVHTDCPFETYFEQVIRYLESE